jgi:hypothetical protein
MSGFPKNKTWKLSRLTYAAKTKCSTLDAYTVQTHLTAKSQLKKVLAFSFFITIPLPRSSNYNE